MSKPKDQSLYNKAKNQVYSKITKHSAYRSGLVVKKYKEMYKKKYGSSSAYSGTKTIQKGLGRWFKEKWRNQKGEVGYKKKGDVYRPTVRVNKDTPKTFNELGKSRVRKAMKEKKSKGRVIRF